MSGDASHISVLGCHLLARVVEAWPDLSGPLKVAILAIIDASPGKGANS
ncbi:MAG: hypothetical protein H8M99_14680 [Gloeobacteraceae cyanobacterium ES-bin-144]|nr:hypothetical protein [Verrucomicrobiales bacterium]